MIRFEFEGKTYEVSDQVYYLDLAIKLPDGRYIQPDFWQESKPPIPIDLKVCGPSPHEVAVLVAA